jgi:hypothetical protein
MTQKPSLVAIALALGCSTLSQAGEPSRDQVVQTLESMTGCYLVDYSYTETEALKDGYTRDARVYDVNKSMSVKEWIYSEQVSANHIRLQHILFATKPDGTFMDGSMLKHTGEDWEHASSFLYDFVGPNTWDVKPLTTRQGVWTRKITNLDDGLRYQCAAPWKIEGQGYAEWSCQSYAPIPGRETRDMGRRDYNTMDRFTRVIAYGQSWLERQENTKIIHAKDGTKTPLAKELGKNWYVRLPDSECSVAQAFAGPRLKFWNLLRDTWIEVLSGDRSFVERPLIPGTMPRFVKMIEIESKYFMQNMDDPAVRALAKAEIRQVIQEYRAN